MSFKRMRKLKDFLINNATINFFLSFLFVRCKIFVSFFIVCMSLKGCKVSQISEYQLSVIPYSMFVHLFDDLHKLFYYTIFYVSEFFKVIKRVVIYTEKIFL